MRLSSCISSDLFYIHNGDEPSEEKKNYKMHLFETGIFFLKLSCVLRVSNLMVHLPEDGCIYCYGLFHLSSTRHIQQSLHGYSMSPATIKYTEIFIFYVFRFQLNVDFLGWFSKVSDLKFQWHPSCGYRADTCGHADIRRDRQTDRNDGGNWIFQRVGEGT